MTHVLGGVIVSLFVIAIIIWSTWREEVIAALYRIRLWVIWLLLLWFVVYLIETNFRSEDLSRVSVWFEVLSGNWSPIDANTAYSSNGPLKEVWVSASVIAAMIVNLGVLIGILQVLRRQLTERKLVVRIANLLLTRDLSIKNQLYNAFPNMDTQQLIDIVNNAFKRGEKHWEENLDDIEPKGLCCKNQKTPVFRNFGSRIAAIFLKGGLSKTDFCNRAPKEMVDEIKSRLDRNKINDPEYKPDNLFS